MHINDAGPSGVVHESNQSDGGRAEGAAVQNSTSGLPSVRLRTATIRTGPADGRSAVQTARQVQSSCIFQTFSVGQERSNAKGKQ